MEVSYRQCKAEKWQRFEKLRDIYFNKKDHLCIEFALPELLFVLGGFSKIWTSEFSEKLTTVRTRCFRYGQNPLQTPTICTKYKIQYATFTVTTLKNDRYYKSNH